ncbi:MAG: Tic20 family protein [Pseudanabaenaceae cyanobacterium bins.39]|nr:Tic20 family protein [Pseudanabaenaceae cyanobacterium bins.39]
MAWQQPTTNLQRLYSCLPYLLPMSASVIYGAILFQQFPLLVIPFFPLIWLYGNVLTFPLVPAIGLTGEFFLFLGLYFLVVRDQRIAHFVRFNTMQSLLMQIALFIVQLIFQVLSQLAGGALSSLITNTFANTMFIGTMLLSGYAIYYSIRGEYSDIPTLSQAAEFQCETW